MRYIIKITVILLAVILNAKEVAACSVCLVATMDKVLPPIQIWCLLAMIWFLLNSLISALYRAKIAYTPKIIEALVILVACLMFAGAFLGPVLILALAITPTIAFLVSFTKINKGNWKNNPYYGIQFVGFAAAIAITITSYHTYQILQNRTLAQYIVQWPGYSIVLLGKLKEKEPSSLADYRYILENSNDYILIPVAERIAIIGDPDSDSKRIEQAIKRIKNISPSSFIIEGLEKSLLDLRFRSKQK
ncbi:MAG: hypothetical protein WAQ98_28515 [Blastocatellia bacterium]